MSQNANTYATNDLPNPFTPMAFLPPELAYQTTIVTYVAISSLAVMIWDMLHNLYNDHRLLFKHKVRLPTIAYFLSRFSTFSYVLTKSVELTGRIDNCHHLEIIVETSFVLSYGGTAFLFFLRVCAIYNQNLWIRVFFGITWLSVIGGTATSFWAVISAHVGSTKACGMIITHGYVQATVWVNLINDTLVFLAVMYKLSSGGEVLGSCTGWKSMKGMMLGRRVGMERLRNALLQDTQLYYLIAIFMNLGTAITYFAACEQPNSPFRILLISPNAVVVNIMACRVFRNLKLGDWELSPASFSTNWGSGALVFRESAAFMGTMDASPEVGNTQGFASHSAELREGTVEINKVTYVTYLSPS